MGKTFTIPTTFSAVDKFSGPVRGMAENMDKFVHKAEVGLAKTERIFRSMTPALSDAAKQMLSFASTAAIVSGVVAGLVFGGKNIMDYETEIQSLSAITGTSGKALDVFKSKIKDVATDTKESSVEVAKAFTMIGNNSPALLADASALAEVTKQSIILAQASRMELAPAAEALTTIMNQFSIPAKEAKSVIDLLAGGMVIGSTDIDKVADAMTRFGGVASQVAGVSLQESVTAIEAISDKMKDAEKIGTQFKNMFLIMSNIKGLSPAATKDLKSTGVNMSIVASKTEPLINKLNELKKLTTKAGALENVFGKENQQSLIPLLASTEKYSEMLKKLTTSEEARNAAQKMADKNNATLARSIEQLKNKFVTWITTSDEAAKAIAIVKKVVGFLANNMSTLFKVAGLLVGAFALWFLWIKLLTARLIILKAWAGAVFIVDMIKYVAATQGMTFAQAAWAIVTQSCTSAMAALNAVMLANPIGLIIIGIVALIALVTIVIKKWNEWGAALAIIMGPLGFIISLIQSFRRNWEMITKAFHEGGILAGLKAIGVTIFDAILMPLQQVLSLIAKFTGANWASDAAAGLEKFRKDMGVNVETDESGNPLPKPAINSKMAEQDSMVQRMENTNNATLDVNVNDPNGRTSVKGNGDFMNIKRSSTVPNYAT